MAIRRDGEFIDGHLVASTWYAISTLYLHNDADGSMQQGAWKGGNQDGWGLKRWGDSSSYEGEWSEGQKHGKGTYSWIGTSLRLFLLMPGQKLVPNSPADGRRYKGNWKNGKKHGTGSYLWVSSPQHLNVLSTYCAETPLQGDGTTYEGEWEMGLRHGHGVMRLVVLRDSGKRES